MAQQPRGYGMGLSETPNKGLSRFLQTHISGKRREGKQETSHQFSLSIYFVASNARARSRSLGVSIPKPLY